MPTIYLKHPVHGTKIANMEAEAHADVANGWKVYNPVEQAKVAEIVDVAENANEAEIVEVAEIAEEVFEHPAPVKRRRRN